MTTALPNRAGSSESNSPRHIYTQPETTSEAAGSSGELARGNCLEPGMG